MSARLWYMCDKCQLPFSIKGYDKQSVILNFTHSMYGTYFSCLVEFDTQIVGLTYMSQHTYGLPIESVQVRIQDIQGIRYTC